MNVNVSPYSIAEVLWINLNCLNHYLVITISKLNLHQIANKTTDPIRKAPHRCQVPHIHMHLALYLQVHNISRYRMYQKI